MGMFFISHSTKDDGFVGELREKLHGHDVDVWIDSRQLRGGDLLAKEIKQAIEEAEGYAILISPDALQSSWVGRELQHALAVQKRRQDYQVIPLSLNDTKPGVLGMFFPEEPLHLSISSDAGGIEAALHAILVALGKREPTDLPDTPQPKAEPLEELVLELTDLKFREEGGTRRATARARLVYQPATPGQSEVRCVNWWNFVAPLGPIEAEDLAWYLEKYAIWPSGVPVIQERARKVEENLIKWGQLLHDEAMPVAHVAGVREAWAKISSHAGRRFSVEVDPALGADATEEETQVAKEAATLLLGLPWELLHDGKNYLFQGAKPTRVRRRLPFTEAREVTAVAPPIRILLVTARPEDDACSYIDHRMSALPLVEAMEALPGLVKIHVLSPPTLPALREELDRARNARESYHVVHFDGHGVYNKQVGLGGLCFEHPDDVGEFVGREYKDGKFGKLEKRRHLTVFTDELGPLLRDHRIPLVFLEACQTAQAEKASESVASELLKTGVASVVAMSHSVLVETARLFVEAFYRALAAGERVGDAMLAGQRRLKDHPSRGRIFGAAELKLEDWFVPVLFQEKDDPQLFTKTPSRQTVEDFKADLEKRLGALPKSPATGFIGRSRELLALQRLLRHERWAVVRGQGGEGKTALAAEFARWMVRSHQIHRAAFVSVEGLEKNITESILDKLGGQLINPGFSTQADCQGDLGKSEQQIARALRERSTLLLIDNMESILLPPFVAETTPDAISDESKVELDTLLTLCERLLRVGETRLIFTSREALPAPFETPRNRRDLHRLEKEDAVKLIERALDAEDAEANTQRTLDAEQEEIERLVETVHCHARTLALLAPSLQKYGVAKARESLSELMVEMEQKFPGSRERSLFACVELSLRRLTSVNRERTRVLGLFHGGVHLVVLIRMMNWQEREVVSLANELIDVGLAILNPNDHLTLNFALCLYLRQRLGREERESLTALWITEMCKYIRFVNEHQSRDAEIATNLTKLDLQNFFVALDLLVKQATDFESTINFVTSLYSLLRNTGKLRLLEQVGKIRDTVVATSGTLWNRARFRAAGTRIEQQLSANHFREAVAGASELLKSAKTAGPEAYPGADYDIALAHFLSARTLKNSGNSEAALPLLRNALEQFEAIVNERDDISAKEMVAKYYSELGECLVNLGRFEDGLTAYNESIRYCEQLDDKRGIAIAKGQLGRIWIHQRRYEQALDVYTEALKSFVLLKEPNTTASIWHQIGMIYEEANQPASAEEAYRKSLSIKAQLGNVAGQASTLGQLGILYHRLERLEEAAKFFRQSTDMYFSIGDAAGAGRQLSNLANILRKLQLLKDARDAILQAISLTEQFGHTSEPWISWDILTDIESASGDAIAASKARRKAVSSFLNYRRDGGENHLADGRIAHTVTTSILAGNKIEAVKLLQRLRKDPHSSSRAIPFFDAVEAILNGRYDHTLADAPELTYSMSVEILLLVELLKKPHRY